MPPSAFQLSPAERDQLQSALRHTRHAGTWCRMRALLLLAQGHRVQDVAAALGVRRQAIHKWRGLYQSSRTPESLVVRSPPGGVPDQLRLAREAVARLLEKDPEALGHQATTWTIPLLERHLREIEGHAVSGSTLRRALHGLGYDVRPLESADLDAGQLPAFERQTVRLPLKLARGEILLCWFDTDLPPVLLRKLEPLLDAAEIARADRFRFARDRDRFIVGRCRLRTVLARLTNRPAAALEFEYGPYGKPAIRSGSASDRIHFNLSESDGLGVIAVRRDGELGVDVERVRPVEGMLTIAERFFAQEEYHALESFSDAERAQAFFRFWTRKEAVVKSTGLGLTTPLDGFILSPNPSGGAERVLVACGDRQVDRLVLALHPPRAGFVAALAVAGSPGLVRSWAWQAGHHSASTPPVTPGDWVCADPCFSPCPTLCLLDPAGAPVRP